MLHRGQVLNIVRRSGRGRGAGRASLMRSKCQIIRAGTSCYQDTRQVVSCDLSCDRTGRLLLEMPFEIPGHDLSQVMSCSPVDRTRRSPITSPTLEGSVKGACSLSRRSTHPRQGISVAQESRGPGITSICLERNARPSRPSPHRDSVCRQWLQRLLSTVRRYWAPCVRHRPWSQG